MSAFRLPVSAINTSSAAAVVPPGEVTFWRKVAGEFALEQQLARTGHRRPREPLRQIDREARGLAGRSHALDQVENIGRAGTRQGRDRVDGSSLGSHSTIPTHARSASADCR